jgi:hypothetical protein
LRGSASSAFFSVMTALCWSPLPAVGLGLGAQVGAGLVVAGAQHGRQQEALRAAEGARGKKWWKQASASPPDRRSKSKAYCRGGIDRARQAKFPDESRRDQEPTRQ